MTESSPEERLLRLIRGPASRPQDASQDVRPTDQPSVARRSRAKEGPWRARATPSWSAVLPVCNGVLGLLLAGFLAAIVWRLLQPVHLPQTAAAAQPLELPPQPPPAPALDSAPFQQRQLFQPPLGGQETTSNTSASSANTPQAQAALATLTLMGIVDGHPPQAIIADTAAQKSYFVTAGETFGAGIQVKKIGDGRVTLSYQGVETDLHL